MPTWGISAACPIRLAWFAVALPALVLNYLGQAALVAVDPRALDNPFYGLAPDWLHYPLVAFATLATVIASQAIISGVFSLTQQAIQLGFLPRLAIRIPRRGQEGQVYLPLANWLLALGDAGGGADLPVVGRAGRGVRHRGVGADGDLDLPRRAGRDALGLQPGAGRHGQRRADAARPGLLLANAMKLLEGGWFPLLIAGVIAFLMLTWRAGMLLVEAARARSARGRGSFPRDARAAATCARRGDRARSSAPRPPACRSRSRPCPAQQRGAEAAGARFGA